MRRVGRLVPGGHDQPTTISLNRDLIRRVLAEVERRLRSAANSTQFTVVYII